MLSRTRNFIKKTRIVIYDEGEDVIFAVGNWELRLPYDVALRLSQTMRVKAKRAKKCAGDNSRHWSVIGAITDANEDFKKGAGWS